MISSCSSRYPTLNSPSGDSQSQAGLKREAIRTRCTRAGEKSAHTDLREQPEPLADFGLQSSTSPHTKQEGRGKKGWDLERDIDIRAFANRIRQRKSWIEPNDAV